jgi:hypothetical protein
MATQHLACVQELLNHARLVLTSGPVSAFCQFRDLVGADTPLTSGNKVLLQYLFAFAAVWGLGGALDSSSWPGWDKAVRSVFDGTANFPQGAGTVMDYYVETE